ncbi:TPA: hypothetical protein JRS25_004101 [Escherichia coli]|nr:hypothetical protein [Escherichia coli]
MSVYDDVNRSSDGWYCSEDLAKVETAIDFVRFLKDKNLELKFVYLSCDVDVDHPAYVSYFEEGSCDVSSWNPTKPDGEGWFIGGIYETEEDPVCAWFREIKDIKSYKVDYFVNDYNKSIACKGDLDRIGLVSIALIGGVIDDDDIEYWLTTGILESDYFKAVPMQYGGVWYYPSTQSVKGASLMTFITVD